MKKILISIAILIIVAISYWLLSPIWTVKHVEEAAPVTLNSTATTQTSTTSNTSIVSTFSASTSLFKSPDSNTPQLSGTFVNGVHNVSGSVRVIDTGDKKTLRFENFKTLNGPDLHIYLSSDNTIKDFVEVGPIRGTEGNINYIIPQGIDLNKHNHVLIWCKSFSVLFGSAELK